MGSNYLASNPASSKQKVKKKKKTTQVSTLCPTLTTLTLWNVQRAGIHPWATALDKLKTGY